MYGKWKGFFKTFGSLDNEIICLHVYGIIECLKYALGKIFFGNWSLPDIGMQRIIYELLWKIKPNQSKLLWSDHLRNKDKYVKIKDVQIKSKAKNERGKETLSCEHRFIEYIPLNIYIVSYKHNILWSVFHSHSVSDLT